MSTNRVRIFCTAAGLIAALVMAGCSRSPQVREAQYLKRGKERLEKRDFSRALLEFRNASQAVPKDAEPYYQIGITYLASKEVRHAAAAFKKALETDPKHAGAQLKLAGIEAIGRNPDVLNAAVIRLQSILASSPDDIEAVNALAIAQWNLGKTDAATTRLEEILKKFPASLRSAITLEQMKLRQKDLDGAEAVLQKAAVAEPKSPLPLLALGQLYLILHRAEKAESAYRGALQLDPNSGPALLAIAALQLAVNHQDQAEQSLRQLASLPDTKYAHVHSVYLYQTGKREAALAEFEKLAKNHPDDRDARTRLLHAYLGMNKGPQAENLLAAALKKNPKDIDALLQRSSLYLQSGKLRDAQQDVNQVLHFVPNAIPAHLALAAIYRAQGLPLRERQELSEALRLNPALSEGRLLLAANFLARNDPATGLSLLDEAPNPQKSTLLWNLERNRLLFALHRTRELREALDRLTPAVSLLEFVLQDALLKLAEHNYAGARAAAEEVLQQRPEDATAAAVIGDAYFAQKQPDKAIERLTQIAAARPNSAPLQYLLGEFYLRVGNTAGARTAWIAAKAADSRFFRADLALSDLDLREDHPAEAHQRLLSVVQANPSDIPALTALARVDELSGSTAEAMATYRTVLGIDEHNVSALNNLAWHLALENPDEGLKFAQQAFEIAPGDAEVEDTLGWVFYRKGVYDTASRYLKDAFSKDPTPRREFHLAMSYIKLGDRELGASTLEAALRKDPNLMKTEKWW
jgi:tetratricopeptide (TPR) repeat protein